VVPGSCCVLRLHAHLPLLEVVLDLLIRAAG
jgi:hypothetical protein